jgi:hypothetical protein
MTLAAGLRVIERAEAVGDGFGFIKLDLIRGMRGVVDEAVGLIIKARGRFREWRSEKEKSDSQQGDTDKNLHAYLGGWLRKIYAETAGMPSKKTVRNEPTTNGASLEELG